MTFSPLKATAILCAFALTFFAGYSLGTSRSAAQEPTLAPFAPELLSAESQIAGAFRAMAENEWTTAVRNNERFLAALEAARSVEIAGAGGEPGVARRPQAQTGPPGPASSESCYGGPVPDYVVTRESGGDPNAVNGQYSGCYQIGQAWWSGRCSHLDRSIAGQKACAQIILETQGPSAWSSTW